MQEIAVVTGANRGIGFEVCRQLAHVGMKVVLTARNEEKGETAARSLRSDSMDVVFYPLDVTKEESIQGLAEWLEQTYGKIDILVNNAGIQVDRDNTALQADIDKIKETMETNVYGSLRVSKALVPIMRKSNFGRIINVSSGMGALSVLTRARVARTPGYCVSKAALNVVTKLLGNELVDTNITVNSMAPGPIRTDMNPRGERSVEEGADTAVWLATECTKTGKFFSDRKEIDW